MDNIDKMIADFNAKIAVSMKDLSPEDMGKVVELKTKMNNDRSSVQDYRYIKGV